MDICILGGTGFIGSMLAIMLSKQHRVRIITRNIERHRVRFPSHISLVEWQGEDATLPKCIEGMDVIVNLLGENIAEGYWTAQRKQILYTSRVQIGKQLVHAIRTLTHRPSVFIQASGIGYYPIANDIATAQLCTETHEAGRGTFLSYLAQHWEDSTQSVESLGIRRCIIRTAPVLAYHGGLLPFLSKPFMYYMGGYPRIGQQPFPCIHLEDEVRAIVHLIENPNASGAYNLIIPTPITTRDFCTLLATFLHKPCYIPIPRWIMRLAFGEMAEELIIQGVLAMPQRLIDEGFIFMYPTASKALADIFK